ncbi:MAG: hypothetical protein P8I82_03650, partial [Flavobacteriales bacterium]|nr:hypothetical protein [Flavobacteriales bacterium]
MKNTLCLVYGLLFLSYSSYAQCDLIVSNSSNHCISNTSFASIDLTSSDASTWVFSPQTGVLGSVTEDSDDKKFFATFQNTGDFTITVTSKESGCSEDIDFTVYQTSEIITDIKTDYYLCNGSTEFDVQLTNVDDFESYIWEFEQNPYENSPLELSFSDLGEKDIVIQATDINGCINNKSFVFTINEGPVYENITTQRIGAPEGCVDAGLDYSIELSHNSSFSNSYVAPSVYSIQTSNDGNVLSEEVKIPIEITFDDFECEVDTELIYTHNISHEVRYETSFDEVLCSGESITLLNTSTHKADNNNFSWSGISGDVISSNSNAITFVPPADGNYNWSLDYEGTCASSYSVTTEVSLDFIDPVLSDGINQSTCDFNLPVNLSHQTPLEFPTNEYSFSWLINPSLPSSDNSLSLSSSNSSATLELVSSEAQSYDLNLSIENTTTGCLGSKEFKNYFSIGGVVAEINSEPSLFCGLGTINTADL